MEDSELKDNILAVCGKVLDMTINNTGDYGQGGECPFCGVMCRWNDSMDNVSHEANCIYITSENIIKQLGSYHIK